MATFSGEAVTPSTLVYEGAVRLDGAVAEVSPGVYEGAVRLDGEVITESYQYVFPILQPIALTESEVWTQGSLTPAVEPALAAGSEAWTPGTLTPAVLPTCATGNVAWTSGLVAPAVAPALGSGSETWVEGTVTVPSGAVVVPPGTEVWQAGQVAVNVPVPRPRPQVFAEGPANPVYVDILRQGEEAPERAPDNVYVFRPRAEPRMAFEHVKPERRLMVAGIGYAPATVSLWTVGLTALVVASVMVAMRRRA